MSPNALPNPAEARTHRLPLRTAAVHHDAQAAKHALQIEDEIERRERLSSVEWHRRAFVFGRVALGAMFAISALAKAFNYEITSLAIGNLGLAYPDFLATLVIGTELLGGTLLIGGLLARKAASALIVYLALVTVLALSDFTVDLNRAFAVANLAFVGGLLMVIANGAGKWSGDEWLRRRDARRDFAQ